MGESKLKMTQRKREGASLRGGQNHKNFQLPARNWIVAKKRGEGYFKCE